MTTREAIDALKQAEALTGNPVAVELIRKVRQWLAGRLHK